jgi:protein-tyrosine-phosphatase
MNVLFVCRANLGRSQMAQAFFNHLSEFTSTSAGTKVADFEGQTVAKRGQVAPSVVLVLELMNEEGLDISSEQRNQLTPELVDAADKVIVMAQRDSWPDYLVEGGKVVFWEISDPVNVPRETAQSIMDQTKGLVEDLVRETG